MKRVFSSLLVLALLLTLPLSAQAATAPDADITYQEDGSLS